MSAVAAPITTEESFPDARGLTERSTSTLLPVLRVIPPHCYERPTMRGLRYTGRAVAIYFAALVVIAAVASSPPGLAWIALPFLWLLGGLAISGLFIIAHDCAHGSLFDSKRLNKQIGRLLMLPAAHVYEAWALGHNRIHHRHTLRQGMDFVWHPVTVAEYQAMSRTQQLRHKLEWSSFGAGAYYLREVWWNKMMSFTPSEHFREGFRRDTRFMRIGSGTMLAAATAVGWLGLGFVEGGGPLGALWFVTNVLVMPFFVFTYTIGWAVYIHHIEPEIKWWPRREWTSYAGQVQGTTILKASWLTNMFFHNIFIHVPHHVDVRIPCYALPEAGAAIVEAFPGEVRSGKLSWKQYGEHTRACKLYDFDDQRWMTYAQAGVS